ncbi:MAG TPA: enolase C-terminal domain-like protein [Chthonomonadaceae bacterium]|nr:enolase C-terminal domain-like protein [Chthonomonadaceae bacterium]
MTTITRIMVGDMRFPLRPGEGADAIHVSPHYSYAVTQLSTDHGLLGTGLAFTLGGGNDLVCRAIEELAQPLVGQAIEELMAHFGRVQRQIADHPQYRWLGPHKGVVHLALASITNACFDLWAKARGVPLWRLLLDLSPGQIVALLDLSYLEDVLSADESLALLEAHLMSRAERKGVIETGYPGYDTSVGWFHYDDAQIRENARRAVGQGFTALKLKVGSADMERDIRRAHLVRETVGSEVRVMLDVNQQWTLPRAVRACLALAPMSPYWIEEPTHPDDVFAHQTLARAIAPIPLALGEHVPNRVLFKNFMQAGAAQFIQVDAVRVAGISEFITISLLARKFGLKVVPHVGDMGQIHQHLVLFNHIALGLEIVFLEYIPHLQNYFLHPARVEDGVYRTPQQPGSSSDLK